jgi:Ca2+-transporting ATPase
MAVVYLPPLQLVFKTSGLTLEELIVALALPWVVLVAVEIEKWLVRRGLIYRGRPQVQGQCARRTSA